ncbi:MAG: type IV pilus modification PilV family protein, partial [Actinomycetota bacterium]
MLTTVRKHRISPLNRLAAEDGMGIIEVIVAMVVFALVTLGIVPMILAGLKSTLVSKTETAAKNLTQERFEVMRNLPFYVGSFTASPVASCYNNPSRIDPRNAAGVLECDYKDLLDTYYRSTFPASSTVAGGYVASNASRSANEISAGVTAPFYRLVLNPIPNFSDGNYSQVIATQFLTADRTVVTPPSTYNTQDSDVDVPPSRLLGVTVISSWNAGANARKFSVYSQIAGGLNDPTSAVMQAQATALRVTSALSATVGLQAEAGLSRSDGTIYNGARASTFAQGAWAETRPGTRIDGRFQTASTPPESTPDASGTGAA